MRTVDLRLGEFCRFFSLLPRFFGLRPDVGRNALKGLRGFSAGLVARILDEVRELFSRSLCPPINFLLSVAGGLAQTLPAFVADSFRNVGESVGVPRLGQRLLLRPLRLCGGYFSSLESYLNRLTDTRKSIGHHRLHST
jgi:hypothetical protein